MKTGETTLPEHLEWYSEQIGGHHPSVIKNGEHQIGLIKERGSELLLKPVQEGIRGECEVAFYDWVNELAQAAQADSKSARKEDLEEANHLARFADLVPKYYGLKTISIGRKTLQCLIMEDLLDPYTRPCTMELKMGKVTYDPNASEAKRLSEAVKYPAQQTLGFRLVGYRMHCIEGEPPRVRDKLWGRSKNLDNIVDAFAEFLSGRPGQEKVLCEELLSQLGSIREWFNKQKVYHLYASSILMVYEAAESAEPRVCARLIDFAHVFPAEGELDDNYLFGINNVITFVERFRERLAGAE